MRILSENRTSEREVFEILWKTNYTAWWKELIKQITSKSIWFLSEFGISENTDVNLPMEEKQSNGRLMSQLESSTKNGSFPTASSYSGILSNAPGIINSSSRIIDSEATDHVTESHTLLSPYSTWSGKWELLMVIFIHIQETLYLFDSSLDLS